MASQLPYAPPRHWVPLGARLTYDPPEIGRLIGVNHGIYRVLSIDPVHQANWTDEDTEWWRLARMPDPENWKRAPARVLCEHVAGRIADGLGKSGRGGLRIGGGVRIARFYVYPDTERWPMCSCCGWPMPCPADVQDQHAEHALATMEYHASKLPGHCWSCQEPVTHRQGAVQFPGINLDAPGGPVVVFHTRRKCLDSASSYQKRWLAAEAGREPLIGGMS